MARRAQWRMSYASACNAIRGETGESSNTQASSWTIRCAYDFSREEGSNKQRHEWLGWSFCQRL